MRYQLKFWLSLGLFGVEVTWNFRMAFFYFRFTFSVHSISINWVNLWFNCSFSPRSINICIQYEFQKSEWFAVGNCRKMQFPRTEDKSSILKEWQAYGIVSLNQQPIIMHTTIKGTGCGRAVLTKLILNPLPIGNQTRIWNRCESSIFFFSLCILLSIHYILEWS